LNQTFLQVPFLFLYVGAMRRNAALYFREYAEGLRFFGIIMFASSICLATGAAAPSISMSERPAAYPAL